jgi:hypothetical protein
MTLLTSEKRMLVALLVAFAAFPVIAGWSQVTRSVEATIFYDRDSLRKSGTLVKMWTLTNFASTEIIEGKSHRSAKSQYEYDCAGERYRLLATIFYELADGAGKVTASEASLGSWYPVAPQSMAQRLWKVACAA